MAAPASPQPTMSIAEVDAMLTGEGGFFETTTATVNGVEVTTAKNRPPHLRALLQNSANHGGDGSARYYVFDDDTEATFAENIATAASLAAGLAERYDIGHGDRVAILAANCPEWIQSFWAITSLGAVVVAMNGWWTEDEIAYGLDLTAPKLLLADAKRADRLTGDPGVPMVIFEDDFAALRDHRPGAVLPDTPIDEDDPATILFTSGTTGRPKGAIITHRNFNAYITCAFILGARDAFRFPADPDAPPKPPMLSLAASPLFHISGLHSCCVTAVASGMGHVWTTGRFDPEKVLQLTEKHKITRLSGVTTQVWRIIEHPRFHEYDTSSVTGIGGGGSVWSPELLRACRDALPHAQRAVGVGYGLTECSGLATHAGDEVLIPHPDSVGAAIPTCELAIHDDDDNPVPDGTIGNVMLRGPMVTPGYWADEAATAETIRPGGWLRTGDFGRVEGGLLFLASRRTDLIIRGGENIYPVEIENRLDEHPAVREVVVLGVDHRELGQEVKAYVVPFDGADVAIDDLAAFVGETLAAHKVPAHWEIRTEPLPRNATGKILKRVVAGAAENTFIEE
ncbi:MAG: class I adenylate-forming enzyme family protein [Actinomycetota bacterium]